MADHLSGHSDPQRAARMIFLAVILAGAVVWAFRIKAEESEIPVGMELIEINQAKFLVPVGTRVTKKNDLYVLEPIAEYVARRITLLEARIMELERANKELEKEQERLNLSLQQLLNTTQVKVKEQQ